NGKRAWEASISKYQNSLKQRMRIFMRELNNVTMSPEQDPDSFLSKGYQLRDELDNVGKVISEERLTDIVIEDLTSEYDLIKYNAERDPDLSIQSIETTMRNMYANRMAMIFTSGKSHGRDSSLLVASLSKSLNQPQKFRGNCYTCGRPGHQARDCGSKIHSNHRNRPVNWCSFHHTDKHDNSECR
ncbi:unnamed protein product, partial [Sphacelaria rigidula]